MLSKFLCLAALWNWALLRANTPSKEILHMVVPASLLFIVISYSPHHAKLQIPFKNIFNTDVTKYQSKNIMIQVDLTLDHNTGNKYHTWNFRPTLRSSSAGWRGCWTRELADTWSQDRVIDSWGLVPPSVSFQGGFDVGCLPNSPLEVYCVSV